MIRNYIIIAWRNLLRNKFISLINIGGLAVGMATFMIIAIYVSYELSYDQYFNNKDKIYRYVEQWFDSERLFTEVASGRKKYLTELAGIKNVARLNHFPSSTTLSGFVSFYKKTTKINTHLKSLVFTPQNRNFWICSISLFFLAIKKVY